jgi:hypothetical protein
MAARTAPHPRPTSLLGSDSTYARVWTVAAVLSAGVWTAIAVLQTPRLPLFCLAAALGAVGGTLFVRAPVRSAKGRQQYVVGAAAVAGLVLVIVGMGHHLTAALTVVALLGGSSPAVLRWLAGS